MGNDSGVLAGLRVLDFGRFIAAPWCSALLGDMGAEVIRVEKREGGEDRWVQAIASGGEGATFMQCNRNKRSVTLDTTRPEGADVFRSLVATADVVVANMPHRAMEANGITFDQLRAIRPDVILASATAYGEGGPYSTRIGFDGTGQVMSGATSRQGFPDQPIRTVVPYADYSTALAMATGVAMALLHRERTGDGQHVEAALLPSCLMMSNSMVIEREVLGVDKPRMGNRGTSVAPCDLYRVEDGWVLLQVAGHAMFERWCRLVQRDDLVDDPRFADDDLRWENGDVLNDIMQEWCTGRTRKDVLDRLESANLPAAPMLTTAEVLDDPHIDAMGFFQRVSYPGADAVPITATPFRMSATPGSIRMRAPMLGEHTDEVLAELGFGTDRVAQLKADGIV